MVDAVVMVIMVACAVSACVLPFAACEIIRLGRANRQLAERNSAQAAALWLGSPSRARERVSAVAFSGEVVEVDVPHDEGGWIIANGNGDRWRMWEGGFPRWTDRRADATRYARRVDAEAVHADDEDAWRVVPFNEGRAERRAAVEAGYADLPSYVADYGHSG